MNSPVKAILAAQGSKEKNPFEFFLATFEGCFFNFSWTRFFLNIVASTLKKVNSHKSGKFFFLQNIKFEIGYHSNYSVKERVAL